jgi:hypothetical protein
MKRVLFLLALAVCVVALTSFNTAAAGPGGKVAICHVDPDWELEGLLAPAPHVIEVSTSALSAHIGHGDYQVDPAIYPIGGSCPLPQ